jgi:hypothetical protein
MASGYSVQVRYDIGGKENIIIVAIREDAGKVASISAMAGYRGL